MATSSLLSIVRALLIAALFLTLSRAALARHAAARCCLVVGEPFVSVRDGGEMAAHRPSLDSFEGVAIDAFRATSCKLARLAPRMRLECASVEQFHARTDGTSSASDVLALHMATCTRRLQFGSSKRAPAPCRCDVAFGGWARSSPHARNATFLPPFPAPALTLVLATPSRLRMQRVQTLFRTRHFYAYLIVVGVPIALLARVGLHCVAQFARAAWRFPVALAAQSVLSDVKMIWHSHDRNAAQRAEETVATFVLTEVFRLIDTTFVALCILPVSAVGKHLMPPRHDPPPARVRLVIVCWLVCIPCMGVILHLITSHQISSLAEMPNSAQDNEHDAFRSILSVTGERLFDEFPICVHSLDEMCYVADGLTDLNHVKHISRRARLCNHDFEADPTYIHGTPRAFSSFAQMLQHAGNGRCTYMVGPEQNFASATDRSQRLDLHVLSRFRSMNELSMLVDARWEHAHLLARAMKKANSVK